MACKRPYKHFLELLRRFFRRSADDVQSPAPAPSSPPQYSEYESELPEDEYLTRNASRFIQEVVETQLSETGRGGEVLYDGFGGVRSVYEKDGKQYESYIARVLMPDFSFPPEKNFSYVAYDTFSNRLYLQRMDSFGSQEVLVYELDECTRRGLIAAMTLSNVPSEEFDYYKDQLRRDLLSGSKVETSCAKSVLERKSGVNEDSEVTVAAFIKDTLVHQKPSAIYVNPSAGDEDCILRLSPNPEEMEDFSYPGIEVEGRRELPEKASEDEVLDAILEEIAVAPRGMGYDYLEKLEAAIRRIKAIEDEEARRFWQRKFDDSMRVLLAKLHYLTAQDISQYGSRISSIADILIRAAWGGMLNEEIVREGVERLWDVATEKGYYYAPSAMEAIGAMLASVPISDDPDDTLAAKMNEIIESVTTKATGNDMRHIFHDALGEYIELMQERGTDLSPALTSKILRSSMEALSSFIEAMRRGGVDDYTPIDIVSDNAYYPKGLLRTGRVQEDADGQRGWRSIVSSEDAELLYERVKGWLTDKETVARIMDVEEEIVPLATTLIFNGDIPRPKKDELAGVIIDLAKKFSRGIEGDAYDSDVAFHVTRALHIMPDIAAIASDITGNLSDDMSLYALDTLTDSWGNIRRHAPAFQSEDEYETFMGEVVGYMDYVANSIAKDLEDFYGKGTAISPDDPVAQRATLKMQLLTDEVLYLNETLSEELREKLMTWDRGLGVLAKAFAMNIPLNKDARKFALRALLRSQDPAVLAVTLAGNTRLDEEDVRLVANEFVSAVDKLHQDGRVEQLRNGEADVKRLPGKMWGTKYTRALDAVGYLLSSAALNAPEHRELKREIVRQALPYLLRGLEFLHQIESSGSGAWARAGIPHGARTYWRLRTYFREFMSDANSAKLLGKDEAARIHEIIGDKRSDGNERSEHPKEYAPPRTVHIA